ncbi:MAG: long-chain fatty acid--CoA ligase [Candidatus Methanomethyliaceae archaeon]
MLLRDVIKRNRRLFPRKPAIIEGDRAFTYEDLTARVNRLANALKGMGITKGDRVAFMGPNCHEFVEFYLACAKTGCIAVPVNARFSPDEVKYLIHHSESSLFILKEEDAEKQREIKKKLGKMKLILCGSFDEEEGPSYEEILEKASDAEIDVEIHPDDLYMIMYTSGATGLPKGVMHTHRSVMANINTMTIEKRIVREDVNGLVMPLFHIGGFWPLMCHMYQGATTVLFSRFEVVELLSAIEKHRITFVNLVPTMLYRLVTYPELRRYNVESLRFIMYAGGPIAKEQLKIAMQVLGPKIFYTGLGSTETGAMTCFPGMEHALEGPMAEKIGSVGKDAIGVEVAIADSEGNELGPNQIGEIIAKGENVAVGYWKMPQETAEAFRDGWFYTGDIGFRDEDGYVFIVDRKKDLIICGGENISPREIEEVLYKHPAVKEVAVIGVPDAEWGEVVKAIVALKNDFVGSVTEAELIDFCKNFLAGYKKPRSIDFMEELPKNAAGKIDKRALKELYWKKTVLKEEEG